MSVTEPIVKPEDDIPQAETRVSDEPMSIEAAMQLVQTVVSGKDPNLQAAMNKFLIMEDLTQQTNLPNTNAVLCNVQLKGYGSIFFPNDDTDPFSDLADILSIGFMARGGWKSNSFVDIVRQVPAYAELQQIEEPKKQGFFSKMRGGTE